MRKRKEMKKKTKNVAFIFERHLAGPLRLSEKPVVQKGLSRQLCPLMLGLKGGAKRPENLVSTTDTFLRELERRQTGVTRFPISVE